MADPDLSVSDLLDMSTAANAVNRNAYAVAQDVLKVREALSATDLQVCMAFRIDPFAYLAAQLQAREGADRDAQLRRYYQERDEHGAAEIERLRAL